MNVNMYTDAELIEKLRNKQIADKKERSTQKTNAQLSAVATAIVTIVAIIGFRFMF